MHVNLLRSHLLMMPLVVAAVAALSLIHVLKLLSLDQLTHTLILMTLVIVVSINFIQSRSLSNNKIDVFHPQILFSLFYLMYFLLPAILNWGLLDNESKWIKIDAYQLGDITNELLIIGLLSLIAYSIGFSTRLKLSGGFLKNYLFDPSAVRLKEMRVAIIVLIAIGLAFKLYHMYQMGGLSFDILRYLSPGRRKELNVGLSQLSVILGSMLSWGALFALFYHMLLRFGTNDSKIRLMLVSVVVVSVLVVIYVTTGKRTSIMPLLLIPLIWRHYLVSRISVLQAAILFIVSITLIITLLFARVVLPLLAEGEQPSDFIGSEVSEVSKHYVTSGELATFDMILASRVYKNELLNEMGGSFDSAMRYTFSGFLILIPRLIWPDKPGYEDPGHVYYHFLTGSNEPIGFAVTFWGTCLLFFDVFGMVVCMYLFGWLNRIVYQNLEPWKMQAYNVFFYGVFYWMVFQFLRFGTLGFTFVYFIQSMFVGVLVALFLARRNVFVRDIDKSNEGVNAR